MKKVLFLISFISLVILPTFYLEAIARIDEYGNYCGGDNTSKDAKPIDAVDYICMLHDKCIDNNNTNCQCDYDFKDRMAKISEGNLLRHLWVGILPPPYLIEPISAKAAAYASVAGTAVMVGHECSCYYKKSTSCWGHKKIEVPCFKHNELALCKKEVPYPSICHKKTHEKTFDATACAAVQVLPGNSHITGPYKD